MMSNLLFFTYGLLATLTFLRMFRLTRSLNAKRGTLRVAGHVVMCALCGIAWPTVYVALLFVGTAKVKA